MKAYPSFLQELHPPFIGVVPAGWDIDTARSCGHFTTTASCYSSRRKRTRRLTAPYCAASAFTIKLYAKGSVVAASSYSPLYHLTNRKLLTHRGRNFCSLCSSNDADYLEEGSDSNAEEEVEDCGYEGANLDSEPFSQSQNDEENGIRIQITKLGKRSRRIEFTIRINASLSTVWGVLTDYESLADFIPGLAVCRLLEKKDNYARLFQIGQQNIALGLKFNAKAVLDCYEKDLEILSSGQRRDIEFKMVEGDFETFEGKWSIEQYDASQALDLMEGQEFHTILSYVVKVEPKLWLPVRLVEGRLCNEIKTNLSCIRNEAQMRPQLCS